MSEKKFPIKTDLLTIKAEVLAGKELIDQIADCLYQKLKMHLPPLLAHTSKVIEEPSKMPEVTQLLGISDTTARDWMKKGILPFHRKGSRVFFFKSEVLKSLEQPLRRGKGRAL